MRQTIFASKAKVGEPIECPSVEGAEQAYNMLRSMRSLLLKGLNGLDVWTMSKPFFGKD